MGYNASTALVWIIKPFVGVTTVGALDSSVATLDVGTASDPPYYRCPNCTSHKAYGIFVQAPSLFQIEVEVNMIDIGGTILVHCPLEGSSPAEVLGGINCATYQDIDKVEVKTTHWNPLPSPPPSPPGKLAVSFIASCMLDGCEKEDLQNCNMPTLLTLMQCHAGR